MGKLVFFLISLLSTSLLHAKCLSDLYFAGLSADSFSYQIKGSKIGTNEVSSSLGMGAKLGRIFYCPKEKLEMITYYRLRYLNLAGTTAIAEFKSLPQSVLLNSFGVDARYLKDQKNELLIDVEVRQDWAPAKADQAQSQLKEVQYMNLKALAGYRRILVTSKMSDYSASLKLGPLIPMGGEADLGILSEVNAEYLRRLSARLSLRFDGYYSRYTQDVADAEITRQELGLRVNAVFRY